MKLRVVVPLFGLFLPACFVTSVPSTSGGGASKPTGQDDAAALQALQKKLEGYRTQAFDASVSDVETGGSAVYFKTYPSTSPQLHRRGSDGSAIDYAFSVGDGDDANDRVSESAVVTAEPLGDHVTYHTYDAPSGIEIGTFDLPVPSDEEKWWAYAVDGATAFVLTSPGDGTGSQHTLWSSTQSSPPSAVLTLEDVGIVPGEIDDFGIDGQTMTLVESGRLWRIDLAAKTAQFLENKTQATGSVDFESDGVVWEDANGLEFFDATAMKDRNVSNELAAAHYLVSPGYPDAQDFDSATSGQNFSRWGNWVVYTSGMGIFAYDLHAGTIKPVLLDASDDSGDRIDYVYPVATASGKLLVVGLTSNDGSIGADGPVYETDLAEALAL